MSMPPTIQYIFQSIVSLLVTNSNKKKQIVILGIVDMKGLSLQWLLRKYMFLLHRKYLERNVGKITAVTGIRGLAIVQCA